MRSEVLQESLSALMDNEADELEVRRVLQAAEQDPALRSTWSRYQVARAVMHKEPWQGAVDLSAGIAAALRDEPELQMAPAPADVKPVSTIWRNLGRVAVAASVTLAVLVGVRMVNQGDAPGGAQMTAGTMTAPSMLQANPAARSGAVLAGYSQAGNAGAEPLAPAQAPSAWHEQRIGRYLREHAESGAQMASPQLIPYARAASMEGR
jgi:sigma-E factor negative regulatory protein RseA